MRLFNQGRPIGEVLDNPDAGHVSAAHHKKAVRNEPILSMESGSPSRLTGLNLKACCEVLCVGVRAHWGRADPQKKAQEAQIKSQRRGKAVIISPSLTRSDSCYRKKNL